MLCEKEKKTYSIVLDFTEYLSMYLLKYRTVFASSNLLQFTNLTFKTYLYSDLLCFASWSYVWNHYSVICESINQTAIKAAPKMHAAQVASEMSSFEYASLFVGPRKPEPRIYPLVAYNAYSFLNFSLLCFGCGTYTYVYIKYFILIYC